MPQKRWRIDGNFVASPEESYCTKNTLCSGESDKFQLLESKDTAAGGWWIGQVMLQERDHMGADLFFLRYVLFTLIL